MDKVILRNAARSMLLGAAALFCLTGCARRESVSFTVSLAQSLAGLTNTLELARGPLGTPTMISSYDTTGGNDDWGRIGPDVATKGLVIADIKGPGCVRRLWMTGIPMDHPIEFYFDGEKSPRIKTTMAGFFGNAAPFLAPLCDKVSDGCYSYMPLPFRKRLKIVLPPSAISYERPYYQINFESFPPSVGVETFPETLSAEEAAALSAARSVWDNMSAAVEADIDACDVTKDTILAAGESIDLIDRTGPDVLRCLWVSADPVKPVSALQKARMLRQLSLQCSWDDAAAPSVNVPLGDFFFNALREWEFSSIFLSVKDGRFISRIPMPFARKARIRVTNESPFDVKIGLGALFNGGPDMQVSSNYFHASWNSATSSGRPYKVLSSAGSGFLVGCYLTAIGMDGAWTILEGDDMVYVDGEVMPSFHGTGLEDYFNGGWYYKGLYDLPFHGLVEKSAIRTSQYRLCPTDPVLFKKGVLFNWEFGDQNGARGYMSSVAYWYQDQPRPVQALPPPARRLHPQDPLEPSAVMSALFEYERSGAYAAAAAYIDEYLEKFRGSPASEMLRLRSLVYREKLHGFESVKDQYARVAKEARDKDAASQAEALAWLHESPSNAILVVSFNGSGKVYLDGQLLTESSDPDPSSVSWKKISLSEGEHTVAMEFLWHRAYAWASVQIRAADFLLNTDETWRIGGVKSSQWPGNADTSTGDWTDLPVSVGCPPFIPFWQFRPNAFIDSLALSCGSPTVELAAKGKVSYIIKKFEYRPGAE